MTATRMCVALAALLAVVPANAQDTRDKKKADVVTLAADDITSTIVSHWQQTKDKKQPHGEAGKCSNCHTGQIGSQVALDTAALHWLAATGGEPDELISFSMLPAHANSTVGVVFEKPNKATRAMLQLPESAGLVVAGVCSQFADQVVGLKANDIVLQINNKPAVDAAVADAVLAASGAVELVVRRDGDTRTLVREAYENPGFARRYLIGVTMAEVEPVVRAQLKLDDSVRVYVKGVAKDGAAAEAGFRANDIIVDVNDKSTANIEAVQSAIQNSQGKAMSFKLLRAGKPKVLRVKARLIQPPASRAASNLEYFQLIHPQLRETDLAAPVDMNNRLIAIDKKLAELTKLIKSLKASE